MFKALRHHADDLHCLAVELDFSSHDVWVASETKRPEPIGQDDNLISARLEFFRFESTAIRGRHCQHWKEISSCCEADQTFRGVSRFGEITVDELVRCHLLKDRILVVLVEEIRG